MSDFTFNKLSNNLYGYNQLVEFYSKFKDAEFEQIETCLGGFTCANMVAPLGGILDIISDNWNILNISVTEDKTRAILQKNEFLTYYGYPNRIDDKNTALPFRKMKISESKIFAEYINKWLLGRGEMPTLSSGLKNAILQGIVEIFGNATMHSKTEYVYVCGQFFPKNHEIWLTIADTGIGIKESVNSHLNKNFEAKEAVEWALIKNNSTKKDIPGGLGFDIVTEFIRRNNGVMQIVSDDVFCRVSNKCTQYQKLNSCYRGTIVSLLIRTDDTKSYILKAEKENNK